MSEIIVNNIGIDENDPHFDCKYLRARISELEAALASERANTPTSWRCTRCGATYSTPGRFSCDEERAKREGLSGKVMFYSADLGREIEVESINLKNNTFVVRPYGAPLVLDGADRLLVKPSPAPDAAALREALDWALDFINDLEATEHEFSWKDYPNCKRKYDKLATLLHSEPRGEGN